MAIGYPRPPPLASYLSYSSICPIPQNPWPSMKIKFETANCIICKKQFSRRARLGNPKQICDDPRCKKIRSLGHEKPVTLDSIPNDCSIYRADIDYYGYPT